ncbi:MAG: dihydrolipoamide acetyltransferase family protein, partial [Miltoncostaeaceae bacterium]
PEPEPEPAPVVASAPGDRVKSSPLARRRAAELGVEIASVRGTGPDGRVVQADVEAAADGDASALRPPPATAEPARPAPVPSSDPARAAPAPAAIPAEPPPAVTPPGEREPLSRLQQTVAKRMVSSKRDAPHFYLQRDVDATDLISLRRELVAAAAEDEGPSINDLIVRAVAVAGASDPRALRRFDDDAFVAASGVHVGIAVAIEDGLLVPVLRDADRKSVGQIAAETRALVARAREGALSAAELEGSTISVSNLGMFGIDRFSAVLNPPEPAMLAVGRAAAAPVVRDGQVVVRDMMTLTLSVDHRALYGADGAVLLGRIAEGLERPHALVL